MSSAAAIGWLNKVLITLMNVSNFVKDILLGIKIKKVKKIKEKWIGTKVQKQVEEKKNSKAYKCKEKLDVLL